LLPRSDAAENDSLISVADAAEVVVDVDVVVAGAAVVVGAMPTVTSPVSTNDPIPKELTAAT
jgi:hypothetical protein